MLTGASLFAGIGGFDLALARAGVQVAAAVEIDPACRRVLARHFPRTALFSDVTEVTSEQLRSAGFVPSRGVLTAGFPCQDLSVAGRRQGLGGARSGLFWHVVRLAGALRPRWVVLENVDGLRTAVCGCPGDGTCVDNGRAVACGRWEARAGRQLWLPWAPHTPHAGACPGGCMGRHGGALGTVLGAVGGLGYGFAYRVLDAQYFGVAQRRERVFIVGCLGDRAAPVEVLLEPHGGDGDTAQGGPEGARAAGGHSGRAGGARVTVGALTTPPQSGPHGPGSYRASVQEADAGHLLPVATLQGGGRRGHRVDAEGAAGGHLVVAFDAGSITAGVNRANPRPGDPAPTLCETSRMHVAEQVVPLALRGRAGGSMAEAGEPGDPAFALRGPGGGSSHPMAAVPISADALRGAVADRLDVRRLTPLECERLQGFPDGWTLRAADGAEQSDAARYRQVGNAVAVPVAEWIARRIAESEAAR